LRIGRHFRLDAATRLVIGRDDRENSVLFEILKEGEVAFRWDEGGSPLGLLIGEVSNANLLAAARILLRYTRCEIGVSARLKIISGNKERDFFCRHDFNDEDVERFRI